MGKDKAITPEWLQSKGFILKEEDEVGDNWTWDFDYPVKEGDLLFVEKELDRKQFAVILTPCQYSDGSQYYRFDILIREDVGCGFCSIPNQFTEMTEYYFSLLYEAIRRKKL
jgi:hypothetical protein